MSEFFLNPCAKLDWKIYHELHGAGKYFEESGTACEVIELCVCDFSNLHCYTHTIVYMCVGTTVQTFLFWEVFAVCRLR